ncbi:MAG: aldose 1-epimerase [Candidatus Melainabacteria bacterium]|nr:aldose 1-epimerase [Candidatus Melainabacteria bacterium]
MLSTETKRVADKDITIQSFSRRDQSAKVSISPELGANVLGLELAGEKIISSPVLEGKAGGNKVHEMEGIPLISPPNRTNKSEIYYSDDNNRTKKIRLANPKEDEQNGNFEFNEGNMIHGRMHKEAWSLKKAETNQTGDLRLTYNFNTQDDPILSKKLGSAEFSMTYTLSKNPETGVPSLKTEVTVTNTSNEKSPNGGLYPLVGLGFHPYINVDEAASFTAAVGKELKLGKKGIPTGELEDANSNINTGRKASKADGQIDATYTVKPNAQGEARSTITQGDGTKIHIDQSPEMGFITIYNGETDKVTGQNKLCIEPLTCPPNASELQFNNQATDAALIPNAITLQPQERQRASFTISVEKT